MMMMMMMMIALMVAAVAAGNDDDDDDDDDEDDNENDDDSCYQVHPTNLMALLTCPFRERQTADMDVPDRSSPNTFHKQALLTTRSRIPW